MLLKVTACTWSHAFNLHVPSSLHNTFHILSTQMFDDQLTEEVSQFTNELLSTHLE
jgi:hypothetical protein